MKINVKQFQCGNNVNIILSDIFTMNFNKSYDLIVSNPPYIKHFAINDLDNDIKNYEPKVALNGGIDGYSKIRLVIKKINSISNMLYFCIIFC